MNTDFVPAPHLILVRPTFYGGVGRLILYNMERNLVVGDAGDKIYLKYYKCNNSQV
jgi:hypothetical protein